MYDRGERISELLLHEVSALLRQAKDPGLSGMVTVTGLKLSKDRKSAVAYYSVLGSAEQRESTAKALERIAPFLRSRLRDKLSLKTIPKIAFEFDSTPERAQRIENILAVIKKEDGPKSD